MMKMSDWAKQEVEIACKRENPNRKEGEWDYGCACYESALKAFNSLMEDGHSGLSMGFTKQILNRLIDGDPLTPIEDTDNIWSERTYLKGGDIKMSYQCKRMSSLFKDVYVDGRVEYHDNNRFNCIDVHNGSSWHNGFVSKIMSEKYPIKMPYIPEKYEVYIEEFLVDPKNGDFDTMGILSVKLPNGCRVGIGRYFKEDGHSFIEISESEYEDRRDISNKAYPIVED